MNAPLPSLIQAGEYIVTDVILTVSNPAQSPARKQLVT